MSCPWFAIWSTLANLDNQQTFIWKCNLYNVIKCNTRGWPSFVEKVVLSTVSFYTTFSCWKHVWSVWSIGYNFLCVWQTRRNKNPQAVCAQDKAKSSCRTQISLSWFEQSPLKCKHFGAQCVQNLGALTPKGKKHRRWQLPTSAPAELLQTQSLNYHRLQTCLRRQTCRLQQSTSSSKTRASICIWGARRTVIPCCHRSSTPWEIFRHQKTPPSVPHSMEICAHRKKASFIWCLILKVVMFKGTPKKRKMYRAFWGVFIVGLVSFSPVRWLAYKKDMLPELFLSSTIYEHEHLTSLWHCAVEG